jgi:hypothetical protein
MRRFIIVDDPVIAGLLGRVEGAAALGHSGRSFLEHLLSTWRILADWRMPVSVCRAGFLHSAYSTSFYPHALFGLDERQVVRRMIGREAEALAFRFCTMDRRGFWDGLSRHSAESTLTYPDRHRAGAPVSVARRTLCRLLIIESANIAEQSRADDASPTAWMSRVLRWWEFLDIRHIPLRLSVRPRLTRRADDSAIEAYRLALKLPARRAMPLLDQAIEHNPWAAEPRILRALCARQTKAAYALTEASRGADLLSAWAVAWDKRLTVQGWKALAERIENTRTRRVQLDFESVCATLSGHAPAPRWLMV